MAETKITKDEIAPGYRQSGWNYLQITATTNMISKVITFPVPFASAPNAVIVTSLGWKSGGVPTSISDFTGAYNSGFAVGISVTNISATGFSVQLTGSGTNNFGVSYTGISWLAES